MGKALKTVWKTIQIVLVMVLVLVLICNLYMIVARTVLHKDDSTIFGWSSAVVLSGSMEPEISVDDLIICKAEKRYHLNDVIMFESKNTWVTHRIVAEDANGFITKGDANNAEDADPVQKEQILGKVVLVVPGVGVALNVLGSPIGMTVLVFLALLLIEVPYLIGKYRREHEEE